MLAKHECTYETLTDHTTSPETGSARRSANFCQKSSSNAAGLAELIVARPYLSTIQSLIKAAPPKLALNSTWQRLAPWALGEHEGLQRIATFLADPAVHARLAECDAAREYPHEIRQELHRLGVGYIFTGRGDDGTGPTIVHLAALAALTAQVNGSLAITVGVNGLALLSLYHAATEAQLSWAFDRVEAGAYCSLLLTERGHGSNLLRNAVSAEAGSWSAESGFIAGGGPEPPTHYRVCGEKYLINGATFHELLITFVRSSGLPPADGKVSLSARSDFSMLVIERADTMQPLPRWKTLPAPAADISGVLFTDTIAPLANRLGKEGAGFLIVQKTLTISRGGIGALAAGCASRAAALTEQRAGERNIYGQPIARLGVIAEGVLRIKALDLLIASMSLKATAMTNACGVGSAHYTSAAKYACCLLAEELVTEGRHIHGGYALLTEHPFTTLVGDVLLYGIFDGTSHLMLEQLQWRLTQAAALPPISTDLLEQARAIFSQPPQNLIHKLRERQATRLIPPPGYLRLLNGIHGETPLEPLAVLCDELFIFTRDCRKRGVWDGDQGLRFAAGHAFALVETLVSLVEFCDPPRRAALGMRPADDPLGDQHRIYRFTFAWFGLRVASAIRAVFAQAGLCPGRPLDAAEKRFAVLFAEARKRLIPQITPAT